MQSSIPKFRFAPSPNGLLHLGHAYSALINQAICKAYEGQFLLRLEDIDTVRCTPAFEEQMLDDLKWLNISWDAPVRRQSEHFEHYSNSLDDLRDAGLIYPATFSRSALRKTIEKHEAQTGEAWPKDPDGAPLYPTIERDRPFEQQEAIIHSQEPFAWRLNMQAALKHLGTHKLSWQQFDPEIDPANGPESLREKTIVETPEKWGDVVLARKDTPTSYHLSVTLDDALQGITHVVRGKDLEPATIVHRLLQELLGLPAPLYHHHDLILGENGVKLSKSNDDTSLAALRHAGLSLFDIHKMIGLQNAWPAE